MYESQEILPIHMMAFLKPSQGGAVHFEILFAQGGDVLFRDAHDIAHIEVHAFPDGCPQAAGGRIERIIEIEEDG